VRSYQLTDKQVRKVARIQQEIRESRGVFATDEEMTALWNSLTIKPDKRA
jgi:DNA-binding PadR family transcriptional regulator